MFKESLTGLYSILPHSVINCALPTSSDNSGTTFFSTYREDSTTPDVENVDNNEYLPPKKEEIEFALLIFVVSNRGSNCLEQAKHAFMSVLFSDLIYLYYAKDAF